ncbi:MAG: GTP-sensing pleiotropic transcriptional regulator CodY [Clostridiales Family XIII bacterium]|nr:GTP-sensing pleiotropic transcriptional regulator CodY [Clostridiales Family XIII bacterium]
MCNTLLEKVRKLNFLLHDSTGGVISCEKLSKVLSSIMDANVHIIADTGELLGAHCGVAGESIAVINAETGRKMVPVEINRSILEMSETALNWSDEAAKKIHSIFPIHGRGRRIGTITFTRHTQAFCDEDIIIGEYGSALVALSIISTESRMKEERDRVRAVAINAIDSLSYSELDAVKLMFRALGAKDGLVVASKIADGSGITRSVFINGLRKLESSGVIESKSLGMKGTHIKVLNNQFLDVLSEKGEN